MKEILFRGFSEKENSFVFGYYVQVNEYHYIFWQGNLTPIKADTVAQFTGLYDSDGKKIFEGDSLYFQNEIYKIVFENGSYLFENQRTKLKCFLSAKYLKVLKF